ncbi:MAG: cysteine-rich CWC family protein [Clostridiales bacterium]|nr:cysteine-rich CWC family protein [Clostridiales bacterium]
MIEKGKCPICGKNNGCAMVAGTDPYACWCMTTLVPKDLLNHIPEEYRNKSCICKECTTNYNKKVCVVGSLNMDLVLSLNEFPQNGETVKANKLETFFGGKGGNQAIAAAKLGLKVSMLGSVGNDSHGNKYIEHLINSNIDVSLVKRSEGDSGQAFIQVDKTGENKIITIGGANYQLTKEWIDNNVDVILDHDFFLMSLEIPKNVSLHLLKLLSKHEKTIILDPAPYSNFSKEMLDYADYITPNETEYELIKGSIDKSDNVILKNGCKGSSFIHDNKIVNVPAYRVDSVDSVGAGDTFNAAVCFGLLFKFDIEETLYHSNIAGALATTKPGAQGGMPTLEELIKLKKINE